MTAAVGTSVKCLLSFQDDRPYVWQVRPVGCNTLSPGRPILKTLTLLEAAQYMLDHPEFELLYYHE